MTFSSGRGAGNEIRHLAWPPERALRGRLCVNRSGARGIVASLRVSGGAKGECMDRSNRPNRERAEHYRQRAIELVNLMADSTGDERLCRRLIELTRQYLEMADGIEAGPAATRDRTSSRGGAAAAP